MVIVGFSGARNSKYYIDKYNVRFVGHDSSITIIVDGKLKFAAEEERFNREKHAAELPSRSLQSGLDYCGLKMEDIDYFAFPWTSNSLEVLKTGVNHLRNIHVGHWPTIGKAGYGVIQDAMSAKNNLVELHKKMNSTIESKIISIDHHMAHIASSYCFSGYKDSAILSIDGSGGYLSSLSGEWKNGRFKQIQSIKSPHSIGILYGLITEFLGFRSGYDEYKVMGMAAYGNPDKFSAIFKKLIWESKGSFKTKYTGLILNLPFCMQSLEKTLGVSKRTPEMEIIQIHFDIAAALQKAVEVQIFKMLKLLRKKSDSNNLCLSGGVIQNSVVNGKILSSKIFKNVFIPPVPGDNGSSLGAAIYAHQIVHKTKIESNKGNLAFLGPNFSDNDYRDILIKFKNKISFKRSKHICKDAAKLLSEEKIIGWFQGRMEYGARALGNRSILASPLNKKMMDKVNITIKNRESFRPFAASVTLEKSSDYFKIDQESPYMQFVVPILKNKINRLEAVNHFETCRIQTVNKEDNLIFHSLLEEFSLLSGDPVLLNTSFNGKDEPIVCSPDNALQTFLSLNLDVLIMGNYIIYRK